jgi:hypothetical protein
MHDVVCWVGVCTVSRPVCVCMIPAPRCVCGLVASVPGGFYLCCRVSVHPAACSLPYCAFELWPSRGEWH